MEPNKISISKNNKKSLKKTNIFELTFSEVKESNSSPNQPISKNIEYNPIEKSKVSLIF